MGVQGSAPRTEGKKSGGGSAPNKKSAAWQITSSGSFTDSGRHGGRTPRAQGRACPGAGARKAEARRGIYMAAR